MDEHNKESLLRDLLTEAFDGKPSALRQWVRDCIGRQAYQELPGEIASPSDLVFSVMLAIQRHVDDKTKLFESLRDKWPGMAERIHAVARHWGCELPANQLDKIDLPPLPSTKPKRQPLKTENYSKPSRPPANTEPWPYALGIVIALLALQAWLWSDSICSLTGMLCTSSQLKARHCLIDGDVSTCRHLAKQAAADKSLAAAFEYWSRACEGDETGVSCFDQFQFCSTHWDPWNLRECGDAAIASLELSCDRCYMKACTTLVERAENDLDPEGVRRYAKKCNGSQPGDVQENHAGQK